jgi:hypothetical protein
MGDLIDVEENVKLQIEKLLTELSKRSDTINEIQGTLLALTQYASDLQTFLGSKSIALPIFYCYVDVMFHVPETLFRVLMSSGIAIKLTQFL